MIELMMIVAIIGLLSAIALPKFGNLVNRSKEAAAKGSLGSVRSALSLYYISTEGLYPSTAPLALATSLTGSRYLREFPRIALPSPANHSSSNAVSLLTDDQGGWFYAGQATGHVTINCTHTDSKNSLWSTW